jgi:hypothetical protein
MEHSFGNIFMLQDVIFKTKRYLSGLYGKMYSGRYLMSGGFI